MGLPKNMGLCVAVNVDIKVKERTLDLLLIIAWMQQAPNLRVRFVIQVSERDSKWAGSFWDYVAHLLRNTFFRIYVLEAMDEMYVKYTVRFEFRL